MAQGEVTAKRNRFVAKTAENGDLNQYWYSAHTIEVMVGEVVANSKRCAFLSTPSIFFSIKDRKLRDACTLFDLDEQWTDLPNYVIYDYREPDKIPEELCGTFDYCVIDPPFITHEVWAFYAVAAKKLLAKGGKILGTTIPENADFLREQLGMEPRPFQPSIPNLVYQYCSYSNYESEELSRINPEIPQD